MKRITIAIDGFSSCGKSTMAKQLAATLGYVYIDTGAMYRAVTLYAYQAGLMADGKLNEEALIGMLPQIEVAFTGDGGVLLNGNRVDEAIRTVEVSNWVSKVSSLKQVRQKMVELQREMGKNKGVVMDGRDIGTVVFPDAELKIFVTADPKVRAQRRYDEWTAKGMHVDFDEVLRNVIDRDYQDQHRAESPLRQADDAIVLDNSYMNREEQLNWLVAQVKKSMMYPTIVIDSDSGFCFGVVNAIDKAEQELAKDNHLYCLGDIVHNSDEVDRLAKAGLEVIEHHELSELKDVKLLFRAHGEPPAVYKQAQDNGITIVDATCPVVLALQKRIRKAYSEFPLAQILIYGKKGHAEVNGLVGQTDGKAIVVENEEDVKDVDFGRPIILFSQTTKSIDGFNALVDKIKSRITVAENFTYYNTICKQVANRMANMRSFAKEHALIFFVSDTKSSNGKVLYQECVRQNPKGTYFVSSPDDITVEMYAAIESCANAAKSIGICGATSTPKWQMEAVKEKIKEVVDKYLNKNHVSD